MLLFFIAVFTDGGDEASFAPLAEEDAGWGSAFAELEQGVELVSGELIAELIVEGGLVAAGTSFFAFGIELFEAVAPSFYQSSEDIVCQIEVELLAEADGTLYGRVLLRYLLPAVDAGL